MDELLARVLIKAKEMTKWVPIKYLVMHRPHSIDLLKLEDDGLILVKRRSPDGILIMLTLKGYHYFK
ncbi:hypothetical protein [Neobacillus vireti]|uniref:hypothetical protein n=1 Tax=Neobacillus vireti TaxID=220686 RepID=UPI002FFD7D34